MLLIIFVELRVVAGRSRTRAGSPQAVSRRACCAVALRTALPEHGVGAAWQVWIRHGRTVQIKWGRHILNPYQHGMGTACCVWIGLYNTGNDAPNALAPHPRSCQRSAALLWIRIQKRQ